LLRTGSGKGRDAGSRGGGGRGCGSRGGCGNRSEGRPRDQSEVNKVIWLQANKYYTAKEYAKLTAAKKAWIHQHCIEFPTPKRKVAAVSGGEDNTGGESYDNRNLFGDKDDKSILSKRSTWTNSTNHALVLQEKKTICCK
jgi:hypothetical protein